MNKIEIPDKILGIDTQLLIAFGLPLALGLGWLMTIIVIVLPKIGEIGDYQSKIAQLSKDRTQLESKRNYLLSIDQDLITKNSESLDMAMLKSKDAYVLVNVLRKVVNAYGYDIDSFSVAPGKLNPEDGAEVKNTKAQKNDLVKIPVNVVLVGSSERFMDLVSGLERTLPILSIEKMDSRTTGTVSEVTMSVSSYFSTDKTDIKVNTVALNDLALTQKENDLIKNIGEYNKTEGLSTLDAGLAKQKEFTKYDRQNPFSP